MYAFANFIANLFVIDIVWWLLMVRFIAISHLSSINMLPPQDEHPPSPDDVKSQLNPMYLPNNFKGKQDNDLDLVCRKLEEIFVSI